MSNHKAKGTKKILTLRQNFPIKSIIKFYWYTYKRVVFAGGVMCVSCVTATHSHCVYSSFIYYFLFSCMQHTFMYMCFASFSQHVKLNIHTNRFSSIWYCVSYAKICRSQYNKYVNGGGGFRTLYWRIPTHIYIHYSDDAVVVVCLLRGQQTGTAAAAQTYHKILHELKYIRFTFAYSMHIYITYILCILR